MLNTFDVDSDSILLAVKEVFKDQQQLSEAEQRSFEIAKRDEIEFFLKDAVTTIHLEHVPENFDLHTLKWVLALKTLSNDESTKLYRARLVSALLRSVLRHFVHGNTPTLMLSMVRMLESVITVWRKLVQIFSENDKLVFFVEMWLRLSYKVNAVSD